MLSPVQRLVSNAGTVPGQPVFYANTQLDAGHAAVQGTGNMVLAATHPSPDFWPILRKFANDPNFPGVPNPTDIWGPSTANGQTYWFATKSITFSGELRDQVLINLTTFCDNAIEAQYALVSGTGDVTRGLLLTDGVFQAQAGTTIDVAPPYNWQKVRYHSNVINVPAAGTYYFILTLHGMNYNNFPGDPNPAGLAFVADIYYGSYPNLAPA